MTIKLWMAKELAAALPTCAQACRFLTWQSYQEVPSHDALMRRFKNGRLIARVPYHDHPQYEVMMRRLIRKLAENHDLNTNQVTGGMKR